VPVRVVIISGVTGSGKTTVGLALAARIGWRFHDADDLHSPESVERMRHGRALTDEMRQPWLGRVRAVIEQEVQAQHGAVIACSALKERYRVTLAHDIPGVCFVLLHAPPDVLRRRLEQRQGHFAGPDLLDSQLRTLEPPSDALIVDATLPVDALVDAIVASLALTPR
jgi:gluconokinase